MVVVALVVVIMYLPVFVLYKIVKKFDDKFDSFLIRLNNIESVGKKNLTKLKKVDKNEW